MTRDELYQKAIELPLSSGVYIMKNAGGEVIYVGKSKKLRNRVSQYFARIPHAVKTERMVESVSDFDYILTDNEGEALVLENIQIKKYLPKYNILLKDDKNYPYIKLTEGDFPRLTVTRKRNADKGEYFGPYSTIGSAGKLVDTVSGLFALPSCGRSFPKDIGKERPCLNYHIGRCMGVCSGNISREEYARAVNEVRMFLKGHQEKAVLAIEEKMQRASEAMEYEKAASYRDTLRQIKALRDRQKVQGKADECVDVIAVYDGDSGCGVTLATVRGGCFFDKFSYRFGSGKIVDADTFCAAMFDIYSERTDIPPKIITNISLSDDDTEAICAFLSDKAGRRVRISTAKIGDNKKLCDMVLANAKEYVYQYNEKRTKDGKTLVSLAKLLCLEVVPARIESYDVSNWGSDFISTGMVVIENGSFAKRAYRSFNAKKNTTQDDCACMAEAVERRLQRALDGDDGFLPLPDLILADGGKAQVSALKKVIAEKGLYIPVFGMVKDRHHKTRTLTDEEGEISIAGLGDIFTFIYRIQEEVHRFSVGRMDRRRRESVKHSRLETLDGVGKVRARDIMAHFGSREKLMDAGTDEIAQIKGISQKLAQKIYTQLHGDAADNTDTGDMK